eukprot:tig00001366_g8396.t1
MLPSTPADTESILSQSLSALAKRSNANALLSPTATPSVATPGSHSARPPPTPTSARPALAAGRPTTTPIRTPSTPAGPPADAWKAGPSEPVSTRSSVNGHPRKVGSEGENVRVIVRLRPLNAREAETGGRTCISADSANNRVVLETKPEPAVFTYDCVAGPSVDQDEFFHLAGKPAVEACMNGYNATIFAYGQTGSGKTYTMLGPVDEEVRVGERQDLRGIIPRTLEHLFETIAAAPDDGSEVSFRVSFLEIYNEALTDLLDPAGGAGRLHLREDARLGVTCENLRVESVCTVREAMALLHKGAANRRVCATAMNHESSRSHTVFTVAIEQRAAERGVEVLRRVHLNLIDLAGSERHAATLGAAQQLRETSNINRSLSTLGHVIRALVTIAHGKRPVHVHYRDSKLTFLLKDSLGGNSKTSVVANVSPSLACFKETLLTLHFARRMKLVRNRAMVNEEVSGGAAAAALQAEVERLARHVKLLEHELFFERVRHRAEESAAAAAGGNSGRTLSTREDALADTNFWLDEPELARRGEEAAEYGRLLGEHRALQAEVDALREVQANREEAAAHEATLLNEAQEMISELDGALEEANGKLADQARLVSLLLRSLHECSCAPPEAKAALAALADRPEIAHLLSHSPRQAGSGRSSPQAGHGLLTAAEARSRFQANVRSKLGARLASPSRANTVRQLLEEAAGSLVPAAAARSTPKPPRPPASIRRSEGPAEGERGREEAAQEHEASPERLEETRAELLAQRARAEALAEEKAGLERRLAGVAAERDEAGRAEAGRRAELERALEKQRASAAALAEEVVRLQGEAARWEEEAGAERRAGEAARAGAEAALAELGRARGTIAELERYLEEEALIREDQHRAARCELEAARAEIAALWSERAEWEGRVVAVVREAAAWQEAHEAATRELELEIEHLHAQLAASQAHDPRTPPRDRSASLDSSAPLTPQSLPLRAKIPPGRLNARYTETSSSCEGESVPPAAGRSFVHYI